MFPIHLRTITQNMKPLHLISSAIIMATIVSAGPAAYAACQAACATSLAAGPVGVAIYAACQAACVPLLATPCP